jgi:hypothetical protein
LTGVAELCRRACLLIGIAVFVWLRYDAYLGPYCQIRPIKEGGVAPSYGGGSLLGKPVQVREQPRLEGENAGLETISRAFAGGRMTADLRPRAQWIGDDLFALYFRTDEDPCATVCAAQPTADFVFESGAAPGRQAVAHCLPGKEARLNGGTLEPTSFFYPRRSWAAWSLIASLMLYAAVPWPRHSPNAAYVTRWRVVLGDLTGALVLFGGFFAAPILILSSSVTAIGDYLGFSVFFWAIAGLGLPVTLWTARLAAYRIVVDEGCLTVMTLFRRMSMSIADIKRVQRARLRLPKWLVWLSFMAVLAGRTSGVSGQAAAAIALSSSQMLGWRIEDRHGRAAYLWLTDPMGRMQLANGTLVDQAIAKAPVPVVEDVCELRAMVPPDWE